MQLLTVDERGEGQRVDNYVLRHLPDIPKTRLYRAMRKGEIRVNKGRVKPDRRLSLGDIVRLPPLGAHEKTPAAVAPAGWQERLARGVILDDERLLVIAKPSGLAVHGGSGLNFGMIETLRDMYPQQRNLELIHRLDRETSGLILIAKRPAVLRELHGLLRRREGVDKRYLALVAGRWPKAVSQVEAPLEKTERSSGERVVRVSKGGKDSLTHFRVQQSFARATLLEARPVTGRTHQIRVHAQHAGHPIVGDDKYASDASTALTRRLGAKRLFLHAHRLRFKLDGEAYDLEAPLDEELKQLLEKLAN